MSLAFREVEVFRPYANEFPEHLLWDAGADETCVERWQAAEMVRIVKYHGEIVALYAMDRDDVTTFRLHGLVVTASWRKQSLGRWVIGHAIGVAESKGGRHIVLPATGASRCFAHIGFIAADGGWRYDLIPE